MAEIYMKELLVLRCAAKCQAEETVSCLRGCNIAVGQSLQAGALAYSVLADASHLSAEDIEARSAESTVLAKIASGVAKKAEISCHNECSQQFSAEQEAGACSKGCEYLFKSLQG